MFTITFYFTVFQLIFVSSQIPRANENPYINQSCLTPDSINGTCQYLNYCESLSRRHQKSILYHDDLQHLYDSQCGYFNNRPMLCCPTNSLEEYLLMESLNEIDSINKKLPIPGKNKCGYIFPVPYVYGGIVTTIGEHSWLALLEYSKPNSEKGFHCGGSIINERYVLTAAHCIISPRITEQKWNVTSVRLGEWDLDSEIDCESDKCAPPPENIPVEQIIVHEMYKPKQYAQHNDIALIRLSREVTFSYWINPICLSHDPNLNISHYDQTNLTIIGWGETENRLEAYSRYKKEASVRGFNLNECTKIYQSKYGIVLNPSQMCALGNQTDTCSGDSGGPILHIAEYYLNGTSYRYHYAVGITSIGPTICATPGTPAVYTRISYYINWIVNRIEL